MLALGLHGGVGHLDAFHQAQTHQVGGALQGAQLGQGGGVQVVGIQLHGGGGVQGDQSQILLQHGHGGAAGEDGQVQVSDHLSAALIAEGAAVVPGLLGVLVQVAVACQDQIVLVEVACVCLFSGQEGHGFGDGIVVLEVAVDLVAVGSEVQQLHGVGGAEVVGAVVHIAADGGGLLLAALGVHQDQVLSGSGGGAVCDLDAVGSCAAGGGGEAVGNVDLNVAAVDGGVDHAVGTQTGAVIGHIAVLGQSGEGQGVLVDGDPGAALGGGDVGDQGLAVCGLLGLIVGIGGAAFGAAAVLVVVLAGGGDDFTLVDGLAAVVADGLAGVAVLGAGGFLGVHNLGVGVLALGLHGRLGINGVVGGEVAGQLRVAVQTGQGHSTAQSAQGFDLVGGQIQGVQLNAAGGGVAADDGLISDDTGDGGAVLQLQIQGSYLGQGPCAVQHNRGVLHAAGQLQLIQVAGQIQDQEVVVIQLVILADFGAGVHDTGIVGSKGLLGEVDFRVGDGKAAVILHQEEHGLAGGVLAVGGIDHVAAHGHGIALTIGAVHQGHIHGGNAGKVGGDIAVGVGGAACVGIHSEAVGGIQLLEGIGGVAVLGGAGGDPELALHRGARGVGVVVLCQNLIGHGFGVDLGPDIAGSGLDVAVDIVGLGGAGLAGIIGILGQGHAQVLGQNAQTCQIGDAFQDTHLAQLQLCGVVAPQLSAVLGVAGDHQALEIAGFHVDHGNIVIVRKFQTGGDVVHGPAAQVQQLAVLDVMAQLVVLQHTVGTQDVEAVEPVAVGLQGIMVGDGSGAAAGIQRRCLVFAGGVVLQHHQVVGAGLVGAADVDGHTAHCHILHSLAGSLIHHIADHGGRSAAVEHIQEGIALAVGEVVACGNAVGVAVGIDHVVVGLVGGEDLAAADAGAGVPGIGLGQQVLIQVIAVDGDPLAAVLGLDIGVEHHIQLSQGLDGNGGGAGSEGAVISCFLRGGGDGHGALLQGGDQAVLVHGGDGGIAAGPGNGIAGIEHIHGSAQLHGFAHIELCLVGLDLHGQVRQGVVGVQGDHGPHIGAEAAHFHGGAGLGLKDTDAGGLVAVAVLGDDQIACLFIIVQGASVLAIHIGHALQVQAGAADIGQAVAVDDLLHIAVEEGVEDIVVHFAAFGHDVVLMAVAVLKAVEIGGGTHIGNEGGGIGAEGGVVGNLIAGGCLNIHHADAQTAVDDAHQTVKVAVGSLGTLGGVGPQPGLVDIGVLCHLEGVGVDAVHGQAVVGVEHTVVHTAGDEGVILALHKAADPLVGIEQIEADPVDLAVGIVEHTVHGHILDLRDGDLTVLVQVGVGGGGHDDGGLAGSHGGDHTIGADGSHGSIGALPGDGLVDQVPGQYIPLQPELGADQQRNLASADAQVRCLVGGFQLNHVLLRNDVQAGNIGAQAAPGVIRNAVDGAGGNGSLAGFGIELVQVVVGADGIQGCCPVEHVLVVIPGHGLGGGIAGGGDVVVVDILTGVAVVGVVHGLQTGDGAVGGIRVGPGVQIDTLIGAVAVVDGVEVTLVVDGQSQQLLILIVKLLGDTVFVGAAGGGDGDGVLLGHHTGVQVDGVDGVVLTQSVQLLVLGVEGHILNVLIALVHSGQEAVFPLTLDGDAQLAVGGDHVDMAAHIFRSQDGGIHRGHILGAAHGGFDLQRGVAALIEQVLNGNLHPGVGGAAGLGVGEGIHSACEVVQTLVVLQLVVDLVAGVVGNHDHTGAVDTDILHVNDDLGGGSQLVLGNTGSAQHIAAGGAQNRHSGHITVVLDGELQVAVLQLHHIQQLGLGAVHGEGVGVVGALADGAGFLQRQQLLLGQIAVHLVVFGNREEAHGEGVAFLKAAQLLGSLPNTQTGGVGVGPVATVDIVEGGLQLGSGNGLDHIAFRVFHVEHEAAGVADQGGCHIADLHVGTDGDFFGGEGFLDQVGVADEGVLIVILIEEGQVVGVAGVGIHKVGAVFLGIEVILIGQAVIHGGIGPVAVEAQHGDGVGGGNRALLGNQGLHEDKALHIGAVGVGGVQMGLGVGGQVHGHGDGDGITGLHQEIALADGSQQQMGVVGGDAAVLADIGNIVDGGEVAGDVVQNDQGIRLIGLAVAVEVAAVGFAGGNKAAFNGEAHTHVQARGILGGVGDAVDGDHVLGEEITADAVDLGFGAEVIQSEGKAVGAVTVGVIAQLHLDLAVGSACVGIGGHPDIGLGGHGAAHIGKTGTLLHDGIVISAVLQGLGGGHQQGGCQLAAGNAQLLVQPVLLDVLHDQGGHTGDLGRGHGGTGVVLVGGTAGVHAVHGVDIAAGGGDLGLHGQVAGNTPGAEGAHGDASGILGRMDLVGDVHGALVADHGAILAGDGGGGIPELVAGDQVHGNGGVGVLVAVHVHDQSAVHIVVDDGGHKAGVHGVGGLGGEVDLASGADEHGVFRHGAADGFHSGCHLFRGADAVNEHITGIACQGGEGRQDGTVGEGALGVIQGLITQTEVVVGEAHIVGGGYGQAVGGGGGRCHHTVIHILHIQHTGAVGGVVCPGAGVTGGDGHDHVVVGQAVQNILVLVVSHEALVGTQGQVHGITAQENGILDGDHVVGLKGAAGAAEDLHDDDLGIGSHTLHGDLGQGIDVAAVGGGDEAVGCGDTGHMGAVVAHAVTVVVHDIAGIHIVDGEGDLLVDVVSAGGGTGQVLHGLIHVQVLHHGGDIGRGQQIQAFDILLKAHTLFLGVLLQGVQVSAVVEALMIGVQTGINDGDPGAGAGVAGGPGIVGADHGGGGGHHGVCLAGGAFQSLVLVLHKHFLNAADGRDVFHLAILDVGGNDVGSQGHSPDHIQIGAVQNILLDPGDHGSLLHPELVAVGQGCGIFCHIRGGIHFQSCLFVQHNGNADHIGVLIRNLFFLMGHLCGIVKIVGVHIIHFGIGKADALVFTGIGVRLRGEGPGGTYAEDKHQCQDRGD